MKLHGGKINEKDDEQGSRKHEGNRGKGGNAVKDKKGENYVDTAVKILIAVVIGALLLAGLYALFGDVVMPTLTRRIQEMFNYAG